MPSKSISEVLRALIADRGVSIVELANSTGVKKESLYTIVTRNSDRASITTLKALADYFQEDLEIFCGRDDYERKPRLTQDERTLLDIYRSLDPAGQAIIMDLAKEPPKPMTKAQAALVDKMAGLNSHGQERLLETCEDMLASARYK